LGESVREYLLDVAQVALVDEQPVVLDFATGPELHRLVHRDPFSSRGPPEVLRVVQ
jgi:hypothetical protein